MASGSRGGWRSTENNLHAILQRQVVESWRSLRLGSPGEWSSPPAAANAFSAVLGQSLSLPGEES